MKQKLYSHEQSEHDRAHTLYDELMCHLPYAIFSVAFCLIVLSVLTFFTLESDPEVAQRGAHILFHSFHFMHIVFAATGTLITFFRFSKNNAKALVVGILSPAVFCMLSDAVLPYLAGRFLGVSMHFHLCFISEPLNILPFLIAGLVNGFVISKHNSSWQGMYSIFSHFIHILISSLASTFYLVSHGFTDWHTQIGVVFVFLVIAVVIPCTFSDVIVPMAFARAGKRK